MATDWAADVRKYASDADDGVIAGIVRHCGIALTKPDSALVSFGDPKELARVRNNFLKKKCALTQSDAELDAAIAEVGARMKGDRTKNRVTVYYLLAEKFGKHDLFAKTTKPAAGRAVGGAVKRAAPVVGKMAAAKPAPVKVAPAKAAAKRPTAAKPSAARPAAVKLAAAPASTTTPPAVTKPAAVQSAAHPVSDGSSPLGTRLRLGAKSDGSGAGLLWAAGVAAGVLALFALAGSRF